MTLVWACAAIALATGCQPAPRDVAASSPPASRPGEEPFPGIEGAWECSESEYDVYAAVLKHLYIDRKVEASTGERVPPTVSQIVLADRTLASDTTAGEPPEARGTDMLRFPDCPAELREAYLRANRRPAALSYRKLRPVGLEMVLIPQRSYDGADRPNEHHVYRDFPRAQGITIFSRAGFNAARDEAVVVESTSRGTSFAHATVYRLRKDAGGWNVVQEALIWIS